MYNPGGDNAATVTNIAATANTASVFVTTDSGSGFFRAYGSTFSVASLAGHVALGNDTGNGSAGVIIFGNSLVTSGGSGSISLRGAGYDTAAENLILDVPSGSAFTHGSVAVGQSTFDGTLHVVLADDTAPVTLAAWGHAPRRVRPGREHGRRPRYLLRQRCANTVYLNAAIPNVSFSNLRADATTFALVSNGTNPGFSQDASGNIYAATLGTGGMVKAAPSTGQLELAAAGTDFQAVITWPTAGELLISNGTSAFPIGNANLTVASGNLIINTGTKFSTLAASSLLATDGGSFATVATVDAPLSYSGGHLSVDGSAIRGASYKFSMNFSSSSPMGANVTTVLVPGDSGALATGAGAYSGTGGTSVPAVLAAAMGASGSPNMYTTTHAYTSVKWAILQQVANVTVASGANVRYSLYMTTDPFNPVAYTLLATFDTGPIPIGTGNFNAFFSTFGSLSIPSDVLFFMSAHRTDVVGSSILSPFQFTSNMEFIP